MNTYIFIGYQAPPLEAIPVGCWAEAKDVTCGGSFAPEYMWYMVYPP